MRDLRQAILGIGAALLSVFLVLGSFSIAFTEGGLNKLAFLATQAENPQATRELVLTSLPQPAGFFTASPIPTEVVISSATMLPAPGSCPFPGGWFRITVMIGDSLDSLASAYGTTADALSQGNCLVISDLIPGMVLYVPERPTSTPEETCGPPPGWVFYTVQYGDTLYRISLMVGVSVYELQLANCMVGQTYLRAGQRLYVPFIPAKARTPTPTLVSTATTTFTPVPTQVIPTTVQTTSPTRTPTRTSTPSLTPVPTEPATFTPTPTSTNTPTETPTPTATSTVTPTSTPTPTPTSSPTLTPSATPQTTAAGLPPGP